MAALAEQKVEQLTDRRQPPLVIEALKAVIVAEAAADLGRPEPGLERLVARCLAEEIRDRLLAGLRRGDRRPARDEAAQHRRPTARHDLRLEPQSVDVVEFDNRLHRPEVAAGV